jgi:eukaryotic-like serine/threonine-protein kinase
MGDECSDVMKPASREQAVFAQALHSATPQDRAAYLDGACGSDTALRRRVEALLRATADAGDFLEQPPTGLGGDTHGSSPVSDLSEHPGDKIGRYKLLERIGEGGCGVVYMAEQEEPVRRRVALKVIKLGMDTKSVIARFEAERQALALMDHPNIAKVLDGGATHTGLPYFVMELVRGVRITEFCDEARLPTEARLRLFVQVCQAVQHAHQKGIIHRDLKPSNILVTVNDGSPVPKVIDFGIAKATGQRLTDKTLFTHFHSFIGTPAYTSPEQAEMSSVDIDTRSDIYSLGVLLYELLTGKTPFDGEELLRSGLDEMRRTIRETEPPRPSTRLTSLVAADRRRLTSIAECGVPNAQLDSASPRRLPPTKELINAVRGDLDWIVMKCLEKDRTRRYETANGLAMDIQRHLNSEPVTARSPSGMYVLQKLAQKNRGALTAAALVLAALLVAVLTLAVGNARIRQERNQKDHALLERSAALETARASEERAREQLFVSLQSQAQARRYSRQMGQRLQSLAALAEAARIRATPELRDNAIAAMAIPDIDRGPTWPDWAAGTMTGGFDALYQRSASVQQDGLIRIRSIPDDLEIQRLQSSPTSTSWAPGRGLLFSPDGRFIAKVEEDGRLWLRRCESGESVFSSPPGPCLATAFSPDGRQIAIGQETSIVCFDLATGQERRRWQVLAQPHTLRFSPNSRRLAVGYSQASVVSIYDAGDAMHVADLPVGAGTEEVIAWHPDGKLLAAAGSDPRIQIWNVDTRVQVSVLESHVQQVTILSFHPEGELLASVSWDCARLWQPSPGRLLMRLPLSGWTGFSADGRWAGVISPSNHQAQLWGIVPSQEYKTFLNTFGDHASVFREGDITTDGALLALGSSDGLRLWDVERGREVAWLAMNDTTGVLFREEGRELLTCGPFDGLRRWRIKAGEELEGGLQLGPPHQIALPFAPVRIAKGHDDRTLAVVGERAGQAVVLDLVTESIRLPVMPHASADYVALNPKGDRLATSGWHSDLVKLWDGQSGKLLRELPAGFISRVFFTPDHRELIVARDREFTFYDLKTLEVSRHMSRDIGLYPGHVAFTSDGTLMALEIAPGLIHLKETTSGRTVAKLEDPQGDLAMWMSFTPDGTQLVVAASYAGAIHRWNLRSIRARLKTMNLDWDWPEFPVRPGETLFSNSHRPLRVKPVGATPTATTQDSATNVPSAKP